MNQTNLYFNFIKKNTKKTKMKDRKNTSTDTSDSTEFVDIENNDLIETSSELETTAAENDHYQTTTEDHHDWYEVDLQLAAELGKTLLERNKELEGNLKQQQVIIEDQALEIEYLSKQTSVLREVNDSRLKVYEQLEVSLQELEKANQKLQHESNADKKKIKSLYSNLDSLEKKCEDLQQVVDELRTANRQQERQKRRERRRTLGLGMEFDAAELRRVFSVENGLASKRGYSVGGGDDGIDVEQEAEHLRLQQSVKELKAQRSREQRLREDLEQEAAGLLEENEQLREQLTALQQQETVLKTLQMELKEMEDEYNLHRMCQQCHRRLGRLSEHQSPSYLDVEIEEEEEEMSSSQQQLRRCAVVKLKNGGLAYGSQESLVSAGNVLMATSLNSNDTLEDSEVPAETTLLSELDAQYRLLIEKYEAMVNSRHPLKSRKRYEDHHHEWHDSSEDEQSSTTSSEEQTIENKSGFSHLDIDSSSDWNACPSNGEESASLSSGFSDGDVGVAHKEVQTDFHVGRHEHQNHHHHHHHHPQSSRTLTSVKAQQSHSLENHFNRTPEYKQLFQEIFAVLKKTVRYEGSEHVHRQETEVPQLPTTTAAATTTLKTVGNVRLREEQQQIGASAPTKNITNVTNKRDIVSVNGEPVSRSPISPDRTYADVVAARMFRPNLTRTRRPKIV